MCLIIVLIYSTIIINYNLILYILLYTHRHFYLYNYLYIELLKSISQINIINIIISITKAISDSF
jgi:hypothetical protein